MAFRFIEYLELPDYHISLYVFQKSDEQKNKNFTIYAKDPEPYDLNISMGVDCNWIIHSKSLPVWLSKMFPVLTGVIEKRLKDEEAFLHKN